MPLLIASLGEANYFSSCNDRNIGIALARLPSGRVAVIGFRHRAEKLGSSAEHSAAAERTHNFPISCLYRGVFLNLEPVVGALLGVAIFTNG